jgi:hypothetical protein
MDTCVKIGPPECRGETLWHGVHGSRWTPTLFCLALLLALAFPLVLSAQTTQILSTLDPGALTAAVQAGGRVTFATNGTILLTSTITILNDVVLDGNGNSVIISGGGAVELFRLPAEVNLTLRNLTLANANGSPTGGAIYSEGNLVLENCQFTNNTAQGRGGMFGQSGTGGAIYNTGVLTVTDTTFLGNSARGATAVYPGEGLGGAIYNSGGIVVLSNISCLSNTAVGGDGYPVGSGNQYAYDESGYGGAIYSSGGSVSANYVEFTGNSAVAPVSGPAASGSVFGGALCVAGGNTTISNSVFSNNLVLVESNPYTSDFYGSAVAEGGSILNQGNTILSQCSISGNRANNANQVSQGGAIFNSGYAQIFTSTISNNAALSPSSIASGGGIVNAGVIQVSNAIMVSNITAGLTNFGSAIYNTGAFLIDRNSFVTANTTGTPPLTFDWQFNGTNITGAKSSIINLTNIEFNDAGTYSLLISNSTGLVTNLDEIFNQPITSAPSFVLQPANQFTNLGATVEFEAAAIGFPAPAYQWVLNGTNIAGATNSTLTLSPVTASDAGPYWLEASNASGAAVSSNAWLIINWPPIAEPESQTVRPGATVTFSGLADGTGVTYQWLESGAPLSGQTNSRLTLTDVSTNNEGAYTLVANNPGGVVRSGTAFLSVLSGPPSFVEQPQSQSIPGGSAGNLWASVAGGGAVGVPPEINSGPLQLWLHADTGAITDRYGRVSQWQDRSANANSALQIDTKQQPLVAYPSAISGMPVIRFNGVQNSSQSEYLYASAVVPVPKAMTAFMMYEVNDTSIAEEMAFFVGVPGAAGGGDYMASGQMAFTTSGVDYDTDYSVPGGTYRIWTARFDTNTDVLELFDDTVQGAAEISLETSGWLHPGPGYYVGGVGSTINFGGDIAELMVYQGALSDPDRLAVVNYLKAKYYQINGPALSFQWRHNGTNLVGATNAFLTFPAALQSDAGTYTVIASNLYGAVASSNAVLNINPPNQTLSSLNEAALALAIEEGGEITFSTNGTILLTNIISVPTDVIIDGTGHSITISGGGAVHLFGLPAGLNLTLRNLTLANAAGSAIFTQGNLVLENCTFTNNSGGNGGAIYNTGELIVSNSVFANNSASGANPACGGAIYNAGATVELDGVIFLNNSVIGMPPGTSISGFQGPPAAGGDACGGAFFSSGGNIHAVNIQAISNAVSGEGVGFDQFTVAASPGPAMGGAMCITGGTASVLGGVFSNNAAVGGLNGDGTGGVAEGAGIFNSGSVTLEGCVMTHNTATGGGTTDPDFSARMGQGGAVYNSGSIQVFYSVISNNVAEGGGSFISQGPPPVAAGQGGGFYNSGTALISSSSLTGNSAAGGQGSYQVEGIGPTYTFYGSGWGGAIANVGLIQLSNSELSNNFTIGSGNGDAIYNTGIFLTDSNSVVVPDSFGTPPLVYDWQLNGTNIAGATSSTINLTNIQFKDVGTYSLLISNSSGLVTNFDEIFNQPITNAPSFVLQPANQVTNLGATVEFDATAIGFPAPAYQWLFDGSNIAGATGSALVLTNVLQNDSGTYMVIATNYLGSATNQAVTLTVNGTVLLTRIGLDATGFSISGEGMAGSNFVIEVSTDLLNWRPLQTNASPFTFVDTNAPGSAYRFYRAVAR